MPAPSSLRRVAPDAAGDGGEAENISQGVGEPGRPCLPWKQETGGSNPPTLTTYLVAVTGTDTAAPAKRVHAGSSPARNSTSFAHAWRRSNVRPHASVYTLVAQWTERRASTSGPCGFKSCRGYQCPRSSTDQSGGFRCPRLRVQIAPWTPSNAAATSGIRARMTRAFGELAERQGTAMLMRRDLRVGQVRTPALSAKTNTDS